MILQRLEDAARGFQRMARDLEDLRRVMWERFEKDVMDHGFKAHIADASDAAEWCRRTARTDTLVTIRELARLRRDAANWKDHVQSQSKPPKKAKPKEEAA